MSDQYYNIPEELRWERQWCVAGLDEKTGKYKAPQMAGPRGLFDIKVTVATHWKDFETALEIAQAFPPCGLGFILTKKDRYTVIDLDVKNEHNYPDKIDHNGKPIEWTTEEELNRFHQIINYFDSYTERSASGQGYHIWVEGAIGEGVRRDGVEVYSQERFIVCTGDVYLDKPIEKRQDQLDLLVGEMRTEQNENKVELVELDAVDDDQTIFDRARLAENGAKFVSLCEGNFDSYPSQSEADLALMSIFAFYSKSNEQCRRLFRMTGLGQRIKATKNNRHLDLILRIIRGRQQRDEMVDSYAQAHAERVLAALRGNAPAPAAQPVPAPQPPAPPALHLVAPVLENPQAIPMPDELPDVKEFDYVEEESSTPRECIKWPPGMVGALARFIYDGSPRPVREVSVVAALGFMAGLCGKAYVIPQSGLNLYIVLVARSAVGKEAMHSGIANILNVISNGASSVLNFVDFNDYASGPGLTKAVAANPSFVNVSGEWGRKLKRLAFEDGRDGPMQQLRTVMTNLYQKSGPTSIVGGIGYSDKEKNVASVSGAAYSMIGETTPSTFYESLTENMMEDGFLSRFTIVEYTGERPPANKNVVKDMDQRLQDVLCAIVAQVDSLNNNSKSHEVERTEEASQMLDDFDHQCDTKIEEAGEDESRRQMWNRAHLKVCRISALLAVGDNHIFPTVTKEHVEWALDLVLRDIEVMRNRISSGDVGVGDAPRERKILSVLTRYLQAPVASSYGVPERMRKEGVVPRKFLQISTQRSSSFTGHRNGHNAILDATIKSLIDSGYLVEIPKEKAIKEYDFHGRCFRVVSLPRTQKKKTA